MNQGNFWAVLFPIQDWKKQVSYAKKSDLMIPADMVMQWENSEARKCLGRDQRLNAIFQQAEIWKFNNGHQLMQLSHKIRGKQKK